MPRDSLPPPVMSSPAYASSREPPSPRTPTTRRRPPDSELGLYGHLIGGGTDGLAGAARARVPHRVRHLLAPRLLSPQLLWSLALYLVHRFLWPLPTPRVLASSARQWILPPSSPPASASFLLSAAFPRPPNRAGDDARDSLDPLYRPLCPLAPPDPPFPRLRPTRFLPPRCMEQWFIDGETLCGADELGPEETLDATWLWVNGSDARWREDMETWRMRADAYSPEHHFREQNELVYSMRSVLAALGGHLRTFHLVVYDFPFTLPGDLARVPPDILAELESTLAPGPKARYANASLGTAVSAPLAAHLEQTWRVAQTPAWLDFGRRDAGDAAHPLHPGRKAELDARLRGANRLAPSSRRATRYPSLRYATHGELFRLPTIDRDDVIEAPGEHAWKEQTWRQKALPSFNSMSIESRIGWLPGLADVSLSLNDDFFILRPHAVSDFHSPLYGNVLRFDHGWYQQVRPKLDKAHFNDAGELGGLWHANYLLSQRFPRRLRPYFAHAPKVVTRGLHHEASLMFKEAITASSARRFRELLMGEGDVQMQWLLTSLRVERWREALLWTYIVANLGGADGYLHDAARGAVADMFGLGPDDGDVIKIEVHRAERWTLEPGRMDRALEQAGWEAPRATDFLFSSMDGHMPPILKDGMDPNTNNKCMFDLDRCLGPFWHRADNVSAADMFKRLTFQYPDCGDCLIMALVTSSGPLGLSAFFPDGDATYTNLPLDPGKRYPRHLAPPHLPLTPTWHEADFALPAVMARTALPDERVNLRTWSMKLLSRYLYVSARSDSHFHMLKDPEHAVRVFDSIQAQPHVSILGLNDDIERGYDETRRLMNQWFAMRWPTKAVWERGWDPVADGVE